MDQINRASRLKAKLVFILGFCLLSQLTQAQTSSFPNRPIHLIVPTAPGAITDIAARLVAQKMGTLLGQPIIVDNKAGAGTMIGSDFVVKSPADGYTLLYASSITHGTLPALSKSLPYDPIKDFTPVAGVFWYASTIVCHPSVPANNIKELIEYAKKNPNKLTNASAGVGSGNHFSGELFNVMAGVQILHVPYKGSGPAMQDVIAGQASCSHDGASKQYVEAGKVKALATTGLEKDPRYPNLLTVNDSGIPGYSVTWWQALAAPAGTPPEVVAKISEAAKLALSDSQLQSKAYDIGLNIKYLGPLELGKQMQDTLQKFKTIAEQAHIKEN
ncbi:MAG: tripartite tricarboxylate transporter substrate binding protein [Betaproteobacteria bacterium]